MNQKKKIKTEDMALGRTMETNVVCEHCHEVQTHEELGQNGTCKSCGNEIREGLF